MQHNVVNVIAVNDGPSTVYLPGVHRPDHPMRQTRANRRARMARTKVGQ